MLIALAVILAWTTIGGAVSLWLTVVDWRCSKREALTMGVVCGPVVWLFIAADRVAEYIGRR